MAKESKKNMICVIALLPLVASCSHDVTNEPTAEVTLGIEQEAIGHERGLTRAPREELIVEANGIELHRYGNEREFQLGDEVGYIGNEGGAFTLTGEDAWVNAVVVTDEGRDNVTSILSPVKFGDPRYPTFIGEWGGIEYISSCNPHSFRVSINPNQDDDERVIRVYLGDPNPEEGQPVRLKVVAIVQMSKGQLY